MSKEAKKFINDMLFYSAFPCFLCLLVNCFSSYFFGGGDLEERWFLGGSHFYNKYHFFVLPFWVFFIPYLVVWFMRNDGDIKMDTRIATCLTLAIALLDPLSQVYDPIYILSALTLSGLAYWFLTLEMPEKKADLMGKYPLGLDPKHKKGIPTDSLNSNVEIVGGTGTGKTRHVIKPFIEQTIQQWLGCFIYDVKSNMSRDVAFYVKKANRGEENFLYFDIGRPDLSFTYNPLFGKNADEIADRVFTALYYDKKNAEPYYMELASAFIHNLVGLLKKEIVTITFQDLATAAGELETFRTIKEFCLKYPDSAQAQYFKTLWLNKTPKQRQEELSGLVNKLQRFCNREWSHLLNVKEPVIRMEDVIERGKIFHFGVASTQYPDDAKPLSILAMMDLSSQVSRRFNRKQVTPFRVFLDEFYNLAYPGFIDLINKCREAGVNLFLAHQSLGDLRAISEEYMEQVMNTARNKIVLGLDDPQTAEFFSKLFGTIPDTKAMVTSYDSNNNVSGYSKPMVEKFRFHPNEIKEMPVGQAIVRVIHEGQPFTHRTKLGTATAVPENFNLEVELAGFHRSDTKNETSLIRPEDEEGNGLVMASKKGGNSPNPASTSKKMGNEDAA